MAVACPTCGAPQRLPLRRFLWRSGSTVVCRSCYGSTIRRALRAQERRAALRVVGAVALVAALLLAVAVLGPHGRADGRRTPAECVIQGATTC